MQHDRFLPGCFERSRSPPRRWLRLGPRRVHDWFGETFPDGGLGTDDGGNLLDAGPLPPLVENAAVYAPGTSTS